MTIIKPNPKKASWKLKIFSSQYYRRAVKIDEETLEQEEAPENHVMLNLREHWSSVATSYDIDNFIFSSVLSFDTFSLGRSAADVFVRDYGFVPAYFRELFPGVIVRTMRFKFTVSSYGDLMDLSRSPRYADWFQTLPGARVQGVFTFVKRGESIFAVPWTQDLSGIVIQ